MTIHKRASNVSITSDYEKPSWRGQDELEVDFWEDGTVVVTIDGRGRGRGIRLHREEFAEFLKALGEQL